MDKGGLLALQKIKQIGHQVICMNGFGALTGHHKFMMIHFWFAIATGSWVVSIWNWAFTNYQASKNRLWICATEATTCKCSPHRTSQEVYVSFLPSKNILFWVYSGVQSLQRHLHPVSKSLSCVFCFMPSFSGEIMVDWVVPADQIGSSVSSYGSPRFWWCGFAKYIGFLLHGSHPKKPHGSCIANSNPASWSFPHNQE